MLLKTVIENAISKNASDIHIEPQKNQVRIRFRINGILEDVCFLPNTVLSSFVIRMKVISHMDVGEKRLPQDGNSTIEIDDNRYDLRFSLIPSLYGECVTIRILPERLSFIDNFDLGMTEKQKEIFEHCLLKRKGLILTSGSTGSGKTSTLYSALKFLNKNKLHILSIEDPIEYKIEGITQVEVNEKSGLTFEKGLRAFVRHDPDVIMIGEIRDAETAKIAVQSALTGHLVLSSVHTDEAGKVPFRLIDMGIDAKILSEALTLVISQKLLGTLSDKDRKEYKITKEIIEKYKLPPDMENTQVYLNNGKIKNRIGAFEMLHVNNEARDAIRNKDNSETFKNLIKKQGTPTLKEAILFHVKQGTVSFDELL
ncbi:type II general secretion pathway (GSP) E protein [Dialister micraerophilus DSM 19965]|uniref:Type II general secretion pathway (GSP) E protein n=2 Tax=Dialister micraerophilus TaxID=309120 RepID=F2BWZ6_9FIRM|nr:type II general secretion pathway (GSP) E protein [Dialister micraerophilus DSM 19965]